MLYLLIRKITFLLFGICCVVAISVENPPLAVYVLVVVISLFTFLVATADVDRKINETRSHRLREESKALYVKKVRARR